MPDDVKQPDNQGAAPAFDPGAFMTEIESRVAKVVDDRLQPPTPPVSFPYENAPKPQPATADDPMKSLIDPYLQPMRQEVQAANLRAQMAEDRAAFYAQHPDIKPDSEIGKQVEHAFNNLAKTGAPFMRQNILEWVKGREAIQKEQAQAERDRAAAASTVLGSSPPLSSMGDKDYFNMSDDQLKLEVSGKQF